MASVQGKVEDYIPAMLAKETDTPFSDEEWIYEIKWDGYRAIAEVNKGKVKLYSRHGNSFLSTYREVVEALSELKINAVLDGEIVVLNEEGKPDFQKLQQFEQNRDFPIKYYVFDLLELNGKKLYSTPLIERKALLADLIKNNPVINYSDHVEEHGEDFFELIKERNMEGIMAKKRSSGYHPGKRSADWLKIKHHKSEEAIIAGFTEPRGGRQYFGALILGSYVNNKFTYIGHTGSGFDASLLKDLYAKLKPIITDKSPFTDKVKTNMPVTWVEPKYVCEVKYSEWTSDGKLRHPIFLRLRDDKAPDELNIESLKDGIMASSSTAGNDNITPQDNGMDELPKKTPKKATKIKASSAKKADAAKAKSPKKGPAKAEEVDTEEHAKDTGSSHVITNEKVKIYKFGKVELTTTNRTKIYFPDEGITKGDVIDYYDEMADVILPYLKDRPESLFRTPNGINQKGFFHKDAGDEAPSWVKHIELYSDSVKKDIDYILCNDKATLLYLANLGCIEINPWHSRVESLDNPDYMIIDIDPSDNNTFEQVIEAALVVKQILDKAGAVSICKTSGASGLHVYVPLGARYTYDEAKDFANIVCMMANAEIPECTTLERSLSKRSKDKIYMDYLQNRKGQTIACVYSMRPKKGATVSTPLDWKEVKKGLTPKAFTFKTLPERLKKTGDLFAPMLDPKNAVDLEKCLDNLGG
jgi:bifunctional non-homologous end joining protein LigD